jgi:hypothetical protein
MVVPMSATLACAKLSISMLPAPASRSLHVDPQISRVLYGTMGSVSRASKRPLAEQHMLALLIKGSCD